jgi:hypothetical protein
MKPCFPFFPCHPIDELDLLDLQEESSLLRLLDRLLVEVALAIVLLSLSESSSSWACAKAFLAIDGTFFVLEYH